MNKKIAWVILFFIALILQRTLMPTFAIFGICPDLIIYFVVFTALFHNPFYGLIVGAAIGFSEDLLAGKYIGLYTISKLSAAYVVAFVGAKFYKANFFIPTMAVLVATFVSNFVYLILADLLGAGMPIYGTVFRYILPQMIYNAVLAPFIYIPVYLFFTRKNALDDRGELD